MDISTTLPVVTEANTAAQSAAMAAKSDDLQTACRQFEGMLMGMIMKNCMGDMAGGTGEASPSGMDGFRDFCVEQVAMSLSENAPLGVAEQLMAQTSR